MPKTILITGSTDGIGLATARELVGKGHRVLLHGRNTRKLEQVRESLTALAGSDGPEACSADLSRMREVEALAATVAREHQSLDVLINNAGVYRTREAETSDGLDLRFAVNTIAPYLLTQRLLPTLGKAGRVINLSSAAQAAVDTNALAGKGRRLSDDAAYAQSKLALIMWSRSLARSLGANGPAVVAINPGSLLGTKMVKEAYGISGKDIGIGADILVRAALDEEFGKASGQYFDNDAGSFASPHRDALDARKCQRVVDVIERVLSTVADD